GLGEYPEYIKKLNFAIMASELRLYAIFKKDAYIDIPAQYIIKNVLGNNVVICLEIKDHVMGFWVLYCCLPLCFPVINIT
ncbi:hypothetical protein ACJX0J_038677, partial [Zea mays]